MPLLIVLLGVALLIFMIIKLKLNTFVSLVVTAFLIALMLQIPIAKIPTTIETGIGGPIRPLSRDLRVRFDAGPIGLRLGWWLPDRHDLDSKVWSSLDPSGRDLSFLHHWAGALL